MGFGKRKSKYNNKKTNIDGITFDSKKEAMRYLELKPLFKTGAIKDLKLQTKFPMMHEGKKICDYVSDFDYLEPNGDDWSYIVEDVKGVKTSIYRLKKKMMLIFHNIKVIEK